MGAPYRMQRARANSTCSSGSVPMNTGIHVVDERMHMHMHMHTCHMHMHMHARTRADPVFRACARAGMILDACAHHTGCRPVALACERVHAHARADYGLRYIFWCIRLK